MRGLVARVVARVVGCIEVRPLLKALDAKASELFHDVLIRRLANAIQLPHEHGQVGLTEIGDARAARIHHQAAERLDSLGERDLNEIKLVAKPALALQLKHEHGNYEHEDRGLECDEYRPHVLAEG